MASEDKSEFFKVIKQVGNILYSNLEKDDDDGEIGDKTIIIKYLEFIIHTIQENEKNFTLSKYKYLRTFEDLSLEHQLSLENREKEYNIKIENREKECLKNFEKILDLKNKDFLNFLEKKDKEYNIYLNEKRNQLSEFICKILFEKEQNLEKKLNEKEENFNKMLNERERLHLKQEENFNKILNEKNDILTKQYSLLLKFDSILKELLSVSHKKENIFKLKEVNKKNSSSYISILDDRNIIVYSNKYIIEDPSDSLYIKLKNKHIYEEIDEEFIFDICDLSDIYYEDKTNKKLFIKSLENIYWYCFDMINFN